MCGSAWSGHGGGERVGWLDWGFRGAVSRRIIKLGVARFEGYRRHRGCASSVRLGGGTEGGENPEVRNYTVWFVFQNGLLLFGKLYAVTVQGLQGVHFCQGKLCKSIVRVHPTVNE